MTPRKTTAASDPNDRFLEAAGEDAAGDAGDATTNGRAHAAGIAPTCGPILTCLADVEPRETLWLWPDRIAQGRLTLLVGRPGEGKSFLTIDAAARVSTGTPWPDGTPCPKGSVILVCAEDDPGDTIRPRLDAHRADVSRVHLLSGVRWRADSGEHERMITLGDIEEIETALKRIPDCKLLVIDPVGSYLGGGTDAHRDNEVRAVLAPIAALAEKYGCAVLLVAHRRKSSADFADDTALGSRAFTGIARAVWHLSRDTGNPSRRLFLPGKNNLAREGDGLAFTICGSPARIAWERAPVKLSADDALAQENRARQKPSGPEPKEKEAAMVWLRAALADGPRMIRELRDEWTNGQDGSTSTLKRARKELRVIACRNGPNGPWWLRLPDQRTNPAEHVQPDPLGPLGKSPGERADFCGDNSQGTKFSQLEPLVESDLETYPLDDANAELQEVAAEGDWG